MKSQTSLNQAIKDAKADAWTKAQGGFAVYRLTNGVVDYFPTGQTPNIAGEPDRAAALLARYRWNHVRWSRID